MKTGDTFYIREIPSNRFRSVIKTDDPEGISKITIGKVGRKYATLLTLNGSGDTYFVRGLRVSISDGTLLYQVLVNDWRCVSKLYSSIEEILLNDRREIIKNAIRGASGMVLLDEVPIELLESLNQYVKLTETTQVRYDALTDRLSNLNNV
jgi:hypothetical protein